MPTIALDRLILDQQEPTTYNPRHGPHLMRHANVQCGNYDALRAMCLDGGSTLYQYFDEVFPWLWVYNGSDMDVTKGYRLHCRGSIISIKSKTTGRWHDFPISHRYSGQTWNGNTQLQAYGQYGRDEGSDGSRSYSYPGNYGAELWPSKALSRAIMQDCAAIACIAEVRCIDSAGNPYHGSDCNYAVTLGMDVYGRSRPNVGFKQSNGYPGYQMDGGASKWRRITGGNWQSVAFISMDSYNDNANAYNPRYSRVPFVLTEAEVRANPPSWVTGAVPTPPPPPPSPSPSTPIPPAATPPPPSPTTGRREIWFGSGTGTQTGSNSSPITSYGALAAAMTQYGAQGVDLRMKAGSVWNGRLPNEVFAYPGTTISGDNWLSDLGYFEGGIRISNWGAMSGAGSGQQLWRVQGLNQQPFATSESQVGAVSVDDDIVAHVAWLGSITATLAHMSGYDMAYTYDLSSNSLWLLMPTGENPNTLPTFVAHAAFAMRNNVTAANNNFVSGIQILDLRFKRYSGHAISLHNLPGVKLHRLYGKHLGGRYASPTSTDGGFIELRGSNNFDVRDISGEGIEEAILRLLGAASQSDGTALRLTGTHVAVAVANVIYPSGTGGFHMDNLLFEDLTGRKLGPYESDTRRPGYGKHNQSVLRAYYDGSGGENTINNLVLRRGRAFETVLASINLRDHGTGARSMTIEACTAKTTNAMMQHAVKAGQDSTLGSGTISFNIQACVFEGYAQAIRHGGSTRSINFNVLNNSFKDQWVAAVQMANNPNATVTLTNNVAHNSQLLVAGLAGSGSSASSGGGNYIVSGTSLGISAAASDTEGAAAPTYSAATDPLKFTTGHALYSGGVEQAITLRDRLGQLFTSTWARGAYAAFSDDTTPAPPPAPPPPPWQGGLEALWGAIETDDGDLEFLEPAGSSFITGLSVQPVSVTLARGARVYLTISVTGSSGSDLSVNIEQLTGSAFASIDEDRYIRANAVGTATFKVSSVAAPAISRVVTVTVVNVAQSAMSALPESLALDLLTGAQTFRVTANGRAAARVPVSSSDTSVAQVGKTVTGLDGIVTVTPIATGTATITVTRIETLTGGISTLTVPVVVTETPASDGVTDIDVEGISLGVPGQPITLQLVDQNGDPLPADPPAHISVSLPGYVSTPDAVVNGVLPVWPRSAGRAEITVTFEDPVYGRIVKVLTFTVDPSVIALSWGDKVLRWQDVFKTWEP